MCGIVLEIQNVLYKVVVLGHFLFCFVHMYELEDEASFLCVYLCLRIQNVMCNVVAFGYFFFC